MSRRRETGGRSGGEEQKPLLENKEYVPSSPQLGSMPIPLRPARRQSHDEYGSICPADIEQVAYDENENSPGLRSTYSLSKTSGIARSLEMSQIRQSYPSVDEFGTEGQQQFVGGQRGFRQLQFSPTQHPANKMIRSSRTRKKTAARSKGGEFQSRRRKRRLYFCCIASEIDMEKLADQFHEPFLGMQGKMYDEVLHLHMASTDELNIPAYEISRAMGGHAQQQASSFEYAHDKLDGNLMNAIPEATDTEFYAAHSNEEQREQAMDYMQEFLEGRNQRHNVNSAELIHMSSMDDGLLLQQPTYHNGDSFKQEVLLSSAVFWNYSGKEVFVFDFGAIVFWGYQRNEVHELLALVKSCIIKGRLSEAEFEAGEDDMAFVANVEAEGISIANDVIVLPDRTTVRSRLAVSFAIAQSSVLSIFEARIEAKIEEYRYIPETLASIGRVDLSPKQLGIMIGDVFVIRHDVNLHSEILDIPDYFWKENSVEPLYRMTAMYLEMEPRTEVLNKRLDLLRELLRLLQHQHENSHTITLEWIVIWLIVVSVILETMVWVSETYGINLG